MTNSFSQSSDSSSFSTLSLRAGDLTLELAPEVGGSVAAFYSRSRDANAAAVHWLRPAEAAQVAEMGALAMASFPLVPWCNRIRDGRAFAHGREIRLQPNYDSAHTIHGLGWQRPWSVIHSGPASARLELRHTDETQGWPWAFTAWQEVTLDAHGFTCEISVRNDSTGLMPLGLGHHPYFPHPRGTRLQCDVAQMWDGDADLLPTGLSRPAFLDELRAGIELSRLELDNNFTGWQHQFTVSWPGRGHSLTLSADASMDFFVLYCPRDRDFFCAEPVSNCTDWLNLEGYAADERGGTVVQPGESRSMRFRMELAPVTR